MSALAARLRALIEAHGPIGLDRYMALAAAARTDGYYAAREPFGPAGDFVTAPEISQTFGELVGLALGAAWRAAGAPAPALLVELGPGRGTLLADARRALRAVPGAGDALALHLVETSRRLRTLQASALGDAAPVWHETVAELPDDRPLFAIANEFLDALPIRQFERVHGRWHERLVTLDAEGRFALARAPRPLPVTVEDAGARDLVELSPAREAVAAELARRLVRHGGLALVIDYGELWLPGDTLQAVARHRQVEPLSAPGQVDLSSHVEFGALARAATGAGARVYGPLLQGAWLERLGIAARLARLQAGKPPAVAAGLAAGVARLTDRQGMGALFKVMALTGPAAAPPPGFTAEELWS